MSKYRYNNEIGFLDIDPQFISIGLKYAYGQAIDSIRIRTLNQNEGTPYDIDFALIASQSFIRNLIINDDFKIRNIKEGRALSNMQSLVSLQLLHPIEIVWKDLINLESLTLSGDKHIRGVSAISSLKNLCIAKSIGQSAFKELINLENLSKLDIGGSRIENLGGIHSMKSLSSLSISYASKLYDISPIKNLYNLKTLHIERCRNITDFSFLRGNSVIEELIIDQVDSLDFVPTMPSLHKIHFTNCINGNLLPLLKSSTIREVYFYPNKKHYTHTAEQIVSLL